MAECRVPDSNHWPVCGVLCLSSMSEIAARLAPLVTLTDDLIRDFEVRLADSSALAFRVAYSVVRQKQDAEDIAQEAFARAYRRFATLRDREQFRSWLVRMTWRLALDHRRTAIRRARREQVAAVLAPATTQADDEERERRTRLWQAMDALPDKLRIVTVLAGIEGQSVRDVAGLLGVPEGTVKSRLFDARKRLQELLR
jgi:RNA polymerase sigma-70 factor (ECF subfamily)